MAMGDNDSILVDSTTRIFQDLCDPQVVNARTDDAWQETLWSALEDAGLTRAWVAEDHGGSGAEIADGFDILAVSGRFAVPVPLAETMIAGWLLGQAGLDVPTGRMTVAPVRKRARDSFRVDHDGRVSGRASGVPFAAGAAYVVVLAEGESGWQVARINAGDCRIRSAPGLSGDGRDTVICEQVSAETAPLAAHHDGDAAIMIGAVVRAVQIGGALQAVLERTTAYAGERVAFERPIAKFQAVQHNLAELAGETAAAVAAASSAADTLANAAELDDAAFLEVASAKIRAGEAAGRGAAIAHQVHGAIGFTAEHVLHRFTQRLWAWRDDFGNESEWAVELGRFVARGGADELWPLLAAR